MVGRKRVARCTFCLGAKGKLVGGRLVTPNPRDACALARNESMGRPRKNRTAIAAAESQPYAERARDIRRRAEAIWYETGPFWTRLVA